MKYLKKFENILEPSLKDCFDSLEDSFNIEEGNATWNFTKESKKKIRLLPISDVDIISMCNNTQEFKYRKVFQLTEEMIDDITSGIGKAEEIGYKFSHAIFECIESDEIDSWTIPTHLSSIQEIEYLEDELERFENLSRIDLYFGKAELVDTN